MCMNLWQLKLNCCVIVFIIVGNLEVVWSDVVIVVC